MRTGQHKGAGKMQCRLSRGYSYLELIKSDSVLQVLRRLLHRAPVSSEEPVSVLVELPISEQLRIQSGASAGHMSRTTMPHLEAHRRSFSLLCTPWMKQCMQRHAGDAERKDTGMPAAPKPTT